QIDITREGNMDSLALNIELTPAFANLGQDDRMAVAKQLSSKIKTFIGVSCAINIADPGQIARSEGKAVRVRDLRNK
ncbi:MAG TPA: phenylacetate--CoA ligase, partial [Oceanospirillaceae bacterium]|nr:phenylacetate--CoA ligase [Oceanospirillaceae bacterium]